jgi:hypothetical protein
MKQLVSLAVALMIASSGARTAHAKCQAVPVRDIELVVSSCKPVDTSKTDAGHAGVVLVGEDRSGKSAVTVTGWISARERPDCSVLKKGTVVIAKLGHACCDGDPNPPCLLDFSGRLSQVKVTAPKKAKP